MGRPVEWNAEALDGLAKQWFAGNNVKTLAALYKLTPARIYQLLKQAQVGPSTLRARESYENQIDRDYMEHTS